MQYFTSNKLGTVSKQYADLYTQYSRHQVGLVKEVVAIAASYSPVFDSIGTLLARLDVVLAFAEVALHAPTPYVRPKMYSMGSGSTILRESRHPCVEVQDGVNFIPNDVDLTRGHSEFLIITGANMGGKSTFIRQIGTIILMAQIGKNSPVPYGLQEVDLGRLFCTLQGSRDYNCGFNSCQSRRRRFTAQRIVDIHE